MTGTVLFIAVLVLGGAAVWRGGRAALRERRGRLAAREKLTLDAWYSRYYRDTDVSQDLVERVVTLISESLGVDAGKLRPTDRFDRELRPPHGWQLDDGVMSVADTLKSDAKRVHVPLDELRMDTVDAVIRSWAIISSRTGTTAD